jgi:HSP20 family protein
MDVAESKDGYTVTVEVAGAKKEDISVESHDNVITIRGEKRDEREEEDEKRHYVERTYGSFVRSFRLPANADADGVNAKFRDGVLHVEIPKAEESKPKVVSVQS